MSLFRTLVISFAVLSFGLAFAEDQPSQAGKTTVTSTKSEALSATVPAREQSYRFLLSKPKQTPVLSPDLQSTCFTLRTYVVRRDGPELDSVHPVGYTSCQPAPRFEVKITTEQKHDSHTMKNLAVQW